MRLSSWVIGLLRYFPIQDLVVNEIVIQGSLWGSIADLREVVALARRGMINYRDPVTRRWRLEEINKALNYIIYKNLYVERM